ncbi:MAG: hypothetical protein AB1782_09035 [Cyanobacteriota bacterium]
MLQATHLFIKQILGFGEVKGELKNKTKVKVFRRKERYFIANRMLMDMQKAVKSYTSR